MKPGTTFTLSGRILADGDSMKTKRIKITTNAGTGVLYEGKHLESGEVHDVDEGFALELILGARAEETNGPLTSERTPAKDQGKK